MVCGLTRESGEEGMALRLIRSDLIVALGGVMKKGMICGHILSWSNENGMVCGLIRKRNSGKGMILEVTRSDENG